MHFGRLHDSAVFACGKAKTVMHEQLVDAELDLIVSQSAATVSSEQVLGEGWEFLWHASEVVMPPSE